MKNPDEKVNIEAFDVKKKTKLYWGGGGEVTDLYVNNNRNISSKVIF